VAAACRDVELVRTFLECRNADVNKADAAGRTPLHAALRSMRRSKKTLPIVKLLIEHGANVKVVDSRQRTVFHRMFQVGEPNCSPL
jgi:ankyrin repeat protein